MKKLNYLLIIFLIAGFASLHAGAEEDSSQTVYKLGEVVISSEGTGVESIGAVREITAEEIEMSGAETLDDALRLLPGINIKTGGQGVPRPDLRGMRPRHVTLLIDGIPYNSAGDGQFDPRLITTENIAKIKVSYGNDSVLYGPGGLGGVINVVTKKGTGKLALDVEGKYAYEDQTTLKASISGGSSKVNFFVSANDYSSDGYKVSDDLVPTQDDRNGVLEDGDIRDNSDESLRSFFGNIAVTPNDISEFGLTVNYIEGEYGVPDPTISKRLDSVFGKNPSYERVDDRDGLSLSLSGRYDIPGPLSIRGWIYRNELEELKNGYNDSTYQPGDYDYSTTENTTIEGASLQTQILTDGLGTLSVSLGTKKEGFESTGTEGSTDKDIKTHSAAMEYEVEPIENLGLVAGYGYSWFKKEGDSDSTGTYLVGLSYAVSEDSRIRASVADKIRYPSVTQLYGVVEGNPNLTYEESMNFELGFEKNISDIKTAFSVTGFRRDVENYIAKDDNKVNQNNEKYRYDGIEVTASNRSIENLYLGLSYTFMTTKDRSTGSSVDDIQYNPKHQFTIECQYQFAYDISVYANIERVQNQYYYGSNNAKDELPDITLINFRVEKKFFSKAFKIYAGANNLFDENYYESFALPREGRTIYGGVKYSFR